MKFNIQVILLSIIAISFNEAFSQPSIPYYVPTNSLVAWWPFNGNANDESGNGNHGSVTSASLTTDRFDTTNRAYYFTNSCYIEVQDSDKLDLSGNFSISYWFKADSFSLVNMVLAKHNIAAGNNVGTYATGIWKDGGNNKVNFQATPLFTPATYPDTTGNVTTGVWHHFVTTYDTATDSLRYYLNNTLIAVKNLNFDITNNSLKLFIGTNYDGGSFTNQFFGKIDDIGIWSRVISGSEVSDLFKSAKNTGAIRFPSELQNTGISVFPNPTIGSFTISCPESIIGKTYSICDLKGKIIFCDEFRESITHVNSFEFTSGIYFFRIHEYRGPIIKISIR